jgi:hypothetical protein
MRAEMAPLTALALLSAVSSKTPRAVRFSAAVPGAA